MLAAHPSRSGNRLGRSRAASTSTSRHTSLTLLVDDGRRTHRIAQLADPGSERAPLAARDAEQWRGTFPVLMALLGEPDISFAIDTGHGFVMLPLPVHVKRPGGPALSDAPRQPTVPDEIRMLWQSARRLEQQVASLGEESSRTRSVAADVRTHAARDRAERHAHEHETRLQMEALVEAREQELAEAIEHAGALRDERDKLAAAHDDERSRLQRERSDFGDAARAQLDPLRVERDEARRTFGAGGRLRAMRRASRRCAVERGCPASNQPGIDRSWR